MVRYFELKNKVVEVIVDEGEINLSEVQKRERDLMWKEIVATKPQVFNGGVWTCTGVIENENKLVIKANTTDYATTTWGRKNGLDIQSMGTCALIFKRNSGEMALVRRTQNVVNDLGKISVAGGVLDTYIKIIDNNFGEMVREQAINELEEELNIINRGNVELMGVAIGEGNKIEWCGAVEVDDATIKDDFESEELFWIPRNKLVEYVEINRSNLEPSTLWHLEYWGKRIAKSKGLEFIYNQ